MKYYDEVVQELFENKIVNFEGKEYTVETIEHPNSPCSGCPFLDKGNTNVCNLCIAYDFYVYVDHNVNERFRLKEVSK